MKQLTTIVLLIAVVALSGCAQQEPAPASETEVASEETITEEGFESGEAENVVEAQGDDGAAEDGEDPGQDGH